MTPNEVEFYKVSKAAIGKSLAENQILGCAETLNSLHKLTFGDEIGGGASTWNLWQALKTRKDFEETFEYEAGAVIISPTGTQPANSRLTHGHTGICGYNCIMSNNSFTGKLGTDFDEASWIKLFKTYGGFPIYYFRKL